MGLARWPYDDFHVLAERREEVHEAFDGKSAGAVPDQRRDMRLLDAKNLPGFSLLEVAPLDQAVDLQGELGLQRLLFGMRQAEVGEDISTAFFYSRSS